MSVIDRDLVRAVNSGKAFALVGAGPSCELGMPTWESLSQKLITKLDTMGYTSAAKQCRERLPQKNFPQIFSIAEKVMSKKELLAFISETFADKGGSGRVYDFIAKWPFACYLTVRSQQFVNGFESRVRERFRSNQGQEFVNMIHTLFKEGVWMKNRNAGCAGKLFAFGCRVIATVRSNVAYHGVWDGFANGNNGTLTRAGLDFIANRIVPSR
jgi:hypothetical protein